LVNCDQSAVLHLKDEIALAPDVGLPLGLKGTHMAEATLLCRQWLPAFALVLQVCAAAAVYHGRVAHAARRNDVEVQHPAILAGDIGVPYGHFGCFRPVVHGGALLGLHADP
jgi:hypothetical protein